MQFVCIVIICQLKRDCMIEYKDLKEIDLKLFLDSGSRIKVDNLFIEPYKLKEIRDFGYTSYMNNIQWISVTKDEFLSSVEDEGRRNALNAQKDNLKTFDFYCKFGGKEILDRAINSMKMIFRTDDVMLFNEKMLAIDFRKRGIVYKDEEGNDVVDLKTVDNLTEDDLTVIHRDNFDEIVDVVKYQNYLKKPEVKEEVLNPVDEATKKLMEDMEKNRQKVEQKNKAKRISENGGKEDSNDISDIISAISSKSNSLNKLNIWELTIHQIYDEYSRLELIDNYDFSIKAMMAGAEKVDLRHWSSKI